MLAGVAKNKAKLVSQIWSFYRSRNKASAEGRREGSTRTGSCEMYGRCCITVKVRTICLMCFRKTRVRYPTGVGARAGGRGTRTANW